jgi:hypothetical protein
MELELRHPTHIQQTFLSLEAVTLQAQPLQLHINHFRLELHIIGGLDLLVQADKKVLGAQEPQ